MAAACAFGRPRMRASASSPTSRARRRGQRPGQSRQELLLDPACKEGIDPNRTSSGGISRRSAAARRREGRSTRLPCGRSDRVSLAEGQRLPGSRLQPGRRLQRPVCCIVGVRGSLVREEPQVARAITQALLEAAMTAVENPDRPRSVPARRAEDLQPRRTVRDGPRPDPPAPPGGRRRSSRNSSPMQTICSSSRSSSRAPTRQNSRSAFYVDVFAV